MSKRQLDGLTGILQIVKGILPDTGNATGAAGGVTGSLPGTSGLPGVAGVSGSASTDTDCTAAVAEIDEALTVSTKLMQATGGQPSIVQILAVLGVLEDSLDDDCKTSDKRDTEMQADDDSEGSMLTTRADSCSTCEQALFKIVQELQGIFTLAGASGGVTGSLPGLPTGTGGLPSLPTGDLPSLPTNGLPTGNLPTGDLPLTPPKAALTNTTTTDMEGSMDAAMTMPQLRRRLLAASRQ